MSTTKSRSTERHQTKKIVCFVCGNDVAAVAAAAAVSEKLCKQNASRRIATATHPLCWCSRDRFAASLVWYIPYTYYSIFTFRKCSHEQTVENWRAIEFETMLIGIIWKIPKRKTELFVLQTCPHVGHHNHRRLKWAWAIYSIIAKLNITSTSLVRPFISSACTHITSLPLLNVCAKKHTILEHKWDFARQTERITHEIAFVRFDKMAWWKYPLKLSN